MVAHYPSMETNKSAVDEKEHSSTTFPTSAMNDSSTFLRSGFCKNPKTKMHFTFLTAVPYFQIIPLFITITHRKYTNLYYGYDSTAFCLVKSEDELQIRKRYIIYGKVSKSKTYFIESYGHEQIEYKKLCHMLL
ncbi:hypothetical protein ENBRE01_1549 [Enteropsectra breve]|nr:hypothetical protein ENBRE01_1549 [Enteropsectra breve]